MTSNRDALISYYIQRGASKLLEYAESTINKKKMKRNTGEQQVEFHTSVMNFIILKPMKLLTNYLNRQILNSMEGKTRSHTLFNDQIQEYHKDISSFQVLYKKYLNSPKVTKDYSKQSQLLRDNIQLTFGERIFYKELEITEIADSLRQINKNISETKQKIANKFNQKLQKEIQRSLLVRRTQRLNYDYCIEQTLEFQRIYQSLKPISRVSNILQESEQACTNIINETIQRWFSKLIDAANLNELLTNPTMVVEWENSLLQKEKKQLMAQQINGKMLFSIQETINNLKLATSPLDYWKQSTLRQKNVGVHEHSFQRQKNFASKEFEKYGNGATQIENDKLRFRNKQIIQQSNKSYEKMADRLKNFKNGQFRQTISKDNTIEQQIKRETAVQKINVQNVDRRPETNKIAALKNQRQMQKAVPPSPLKPEEMSKFKLKSKERIQNYIDKGVGKSQTSSNPLLKNKVKVQIRFPVRIDNFQMESWSSNYLIYKAEAINLKQLPLAFIKDRHKFGENRVKIEYPCRPQEGVIDAIAKSMQILNCLGAEVFCEQEVSYKSVNQIDSAQILSISWLLQKPVKQIIKYYGEHFAGCQTTRK